MRGGERTDARRHGASASGQARADARRGLAAAGSGARTTQGAGPRVPARRMISARSEGIESWAGSGCGRAALTRRRAPRVIYDDGGRLRALRPRRGGRRARSPRDRARRAADRSSALTYARDAAVRRIPARGEADHRRRRLERRRRRARSRRATCLRPMFSRGEPLDFYAYMTRSPASTRGDLDALVEIDTGVPLCGVAASPGTATETSPGTEDTGERVPSCIVFIPRTSAQRHAASARVFRSRGKAARPAGRRYDPEDVFVASDAALSVLSQAAARGAEEFAVRGDDRRPRGRGRRRGRGRGRGRGCGSSPGTFLRTGRILLPERRGERRGTSVGCRYPRAPTVSLRGRLHFDPYPNRMPSRRCAR